MISTRAKTLLSASALSLLAMNVVLPVAADLTFSKAFVAQAQTQGHSIIVEPAQFRELIAQGAKIVDTRQPAAYENGHIKGAVNLPWAKLNVSERDGIRNEFAEDEVFERELSAAGLNAGDTLVIYDSNALPGRAFVALEYAGFKNIHVLNGGVKAWDEELTTEVTAVEPSAFKLTEKNDMRVDKSYVASRLNAEDAVVIDGRNADAYVDGHIPGAKSLAAGGLLTEDAKVKPAEFINGLLAARGIDFSKEILSYCGSGVAASNNYVALRNLGYTNIKIYDESWDEWSRDPAAGQSLALGNYAFTGEALAAAPAGPSFLSAEEVRALAQDPNVVVVDVRSPSDYSAGQIPGSVNVFWDDTLDENRVLKSVDELKDIYAEVGVTADTRVVLSTRGGVQLTHSYTVLSLLGFDKVDFFTGKFEGWENGAMKKG